jgi:hypothetical protein
LGVALALGGCQSPEPTKSKEPGPPAPEAAPEAAHSAETPTVNFKVDGVKLPTIALPGETVVLSLSALPPIEKWKMLIVKNIEGREFRAVKPKLLTGKRTMKIVKLTDQSYEFRVMELVGDEETTRHRMPKVKVVEIQTLSYTPPPDMANRAVAIRSNGKTRDLDKATLEAIPKTPEPGSEKNRDTWLLLDLLGKKSLADSESIVLRKRSGVELVLTSKELADRKAMHIIKRNRRGQFHYRGWTLGEQPVKTSELRGVVGIELR